MHATAFLRSASRRADRVEGVAGGRHGGIGSRIDLSGRPEGRGPFPLPAAAPFPADNEAAIGGIIEVSSSGA